MESLAISSEQVNLLKYSEQFTNAVWSTSTITVTDNDARDASGELIAAKLECIAATNPTLVQNYDTGVALASRSFTFSIWLWIDEGQPTEFQLYIYDDSAGDPAHENITLTTTPTRYSVTHTFGGSEADTALNCRLDPMGTSTPSGGEYLYCSKAQLSETADVMPYITTTDTIYDGSTIAYLDFDPEYDYKKGDKKIEDTHRAKSGDLYQYKWGEYNVAEFTIEFLSPSDKDIINTWWSSNTSLMFHNNLTGENWPCKIMNKSVPVNQLIKPYFDQYKTKLLVEEF